MFFCPDKMTALEHFLDLIVIAIINIIITPFPAASPAGVEVGGGGILNHLMRNTTALDRGGFLVCGTG